MREGCFLPHFEKKAESEVPVDSRVISRTEARFLAELWREPHELITAVSFNKIDLGVTAEPIVRN